MAESQSQDLVTTNPGTDPTRSAEFNRAQEEFSLNWRLARVIAASKRFPDAYAPEQAMAKMLLGAELGLSPMQSMTGINIVEGRPELAAVQMAAIVRQHDDYEYEVKRLDNEGCEIEFTRGDKSVGTSTFTQADAEKAGLNKPRSGYDHFPRNMFFSRAMSNGVKWFCPDATHGMAVYDLGEISASPSGAGVTMAEGTGEAPGVELPPAVVAVLERAQNLGHAGLADRPAVEMALGGQPPEFVERWVAEATQTLDAMAAVDVPIDTEGLPEPPEELAVVEEPAPPPAPAPEPEPEPEEPPKPSDPEPPDESLSDTVQAEVDSVDVA